MIFAAHHSHTVPTDLAVKLILAAETNSSIVNSDKIHDISCDALILSRISSHEERLDYRRDGFGVWVEGHRRSPEHYDSGTMKKAGEGTGDLIVRRMTWTNKAAPSLRRTEVSIIRVSGYW